MTKPKLRMHADGQISMYVADGFANFLSGLGQGDLKASANTYVPPVMTPELEAAYRTSTWFGKIVDIPADDQVREWRTWQLDDDQVTKVEAEERRLGLKYKIRQAIVWQRLYGGSAIILGGLPGEAREPLDLEAVGVGGIKFASVVTRSELATAQLITNALDPLFGQPSMYSLTNGSQMEIHPTRVIPFRGVQVSPMSAQQDFWGDPIWFRLQDAILSADTTGAVIDALLQESKVDVLRVSGMMKGMATAEYESLMLKRFTMVAILKGMQNVMLLDKDDEWEQKQINWSGIPDVAKHVLNILSGASNIPMFRLTGQNLTGLSNTGEAEQRAYYDGVQADQNLDLRPAMDPLDNILIRSALGTYPENAWYDWNSLYQMSDKEKAEIDKMEAETANIYSVSGLIPSEALAKAVQARMIKSGRWPALEKALDEVEANDEGGDDQDAIDKVTALMAAASKAQAANTEDPEATTRPQLRVIGDATPRTLYVSRKVKNWADLAKHFKAQGFKTTVGAEMHVTIVYSKEPVDWMKVGGSWEEEVKIPSGGPRLMEAFGSTGEAKVLLFQHHDLKWRHESAREAGASYDFDEYQPHITISYDPDVDVTQVEPYTGPIVLGPEIFKEIVEDWKVGLVEDSKDDKKE